ncbi:hypothetical protein AAFF_G00106560 [Aldrovandia affinis]|uniref:Uncharacterized protein n=1 Tax=Aldrovandia affinis TaxID=143900 RepID=A0AAD7T273_9TELE|nr:hypothetical protein AAFF_G00106560 [Aldrovandia affinis]
MTRGAVHPQPGPGKPRRDRFRCFQTPHQVKHSAARLNWYSGGIQSIAKRTQAGAVTELYLLITTPRPSRGEEGRALLRDEIRTWIIVISAPHNLSFCDPCNAGHRRGWSSGLTSRKGTRP